MLLKSILSACLFFMIQTNLFAQTEKKPDWVNMMDDPNTNYFQTIDEFKDYWSTRMIPGEAHEDGKCEEEEKDNRSFLKKLFQSEEKALAKSLELVIDYKRFIKWQREMLPFVQSDGTILSEEERWKIIQSQNQNAQ